MLTQNYNQLAIRIPGALRLVGLVGGSWALLVILAATLAYLPGHPDFSPFTTFLSDIGDTPGWPQILFNSGTLIAVPIRFLALVMIVLRLIELGAGRKFAIPALIIGFFSTAGTAMMTATPFSVAPTIHKTGIGFYFLGIVLLQGLIFAREWTLRGVPRILPLLSLLMVGFYLVFVTLLVLYESGAVGRSAPVIWEWLAILTSIVWLLAHAMLLGRTEFDR